MRCCMHCLGSIGLKVSSSRNDSVIPHPGTGLVPPHSVRRGVTLGCHLSAPSTGSAGVKSFLYPITNHMIPYQTPWVFAPAPTALTPRGVFCGVTVLSKPAPFLASTSPRLEWDPANPDAPQEFTVMKHQPMHSSQMTQTSLSPPDWIQKSV